MAESLYDVILPHLEDGTPAEASPNTATLQYLTRLSNFSLEALETTEPDSLDFDAQSSLRALQALAKRSYKTINTSAESLSHVQDTVPGLSSGSSALEKLIPNLERDATSFGDKYAKGTDNSLLDRRKRAMRLGENVNKLSDILELPTLLTSAIAASAVTTSTTGQTALSSTNASYATALDLYGHIKRLQRFYPSSDLVRGISVQAEDAMRIMTTNLITSLRTQSLKLAGALRLVGLLRRVAPELDDSVDAKKDWTSGSSEGSLGALFLVCRLCNLTAMLDALEPLRELAESESAARQHTGEQNRARSAWAAGQQSEKYLKRYIEVFREQCFAIVSMYKSIFPSSLPGPSSNSSAEGTPLSPSVQKLALQSDHSQQTELLNDTMQQLPPALATFTFQLVDELTDTLKTFLPNVRDRSSRDSLLTQILYCAGSLGRLGGDFGMTLALLEDELGSSEDRHDGASPEWIDVVKKHRVQASRLELLASGVGSGRTSITSPKEITSPG